MKKILAVALVLWLTVMVIQPMAAEAGGGGWHGGGSRGGHGYWGPGPWLFGIAALGATSTILAPRVYAYPAYPPVVYAPAPVVVAPYPSVVVIPQAQVSIQRTACYPDGCYYLQGNGVQVPYQWVWMPR
ncbi:MAG: hypothetical protein HYR50_14625 [Candidatus Rokubacteria bacterium]|nr:hypothetical protein [Candidatus Rokubacteria bacterium]